MESESTGNIIGVQCKFTKKPVGRPDVQKFYGALSHHNFAGISFDKGFLVSVSGFSDEAVQYVNKVNSKRDERFLRLLDFDEL